MQIVRTILWVLLFVALLAFSFFNWEAVEVTLWENLVLETKVPALVIVSFALGLVPMWIYHRGVKWSLNRRIRSLENAARSNALQKRQEPEPGPAPEPKPAHATGAAGGAESPTGDGGGLLSPVDPSQTPHPADPK